VAPATRGWPAREVLTLTHQYLDDNPPATLSDLYTVSLSVSDDDLGTSGTSADVTVDNLDPAIDSLNITSPTNENGTATLTGTYHD